MSTAAVPSPRFRVHYPDTDGKPMAENTLQFEWIVKIKEGLDALAQELRVQVISSSAAQLTDEPNAAALILWAIGDKGTHPKAADLLSESKIVGWFGGAAEVGPRALGARSVRGITSLAFMMVPLLPSM